MSTLNLTSVRQPGVLCMNIASLQEDVDALVDQLEEMRHLANFELASPVHPDSVKPLYNKMTLTLMFGRDASPTEVLAEVLPLFSYFYVAPDIIQVKGGGALADDVVVEVYLHWYIYSGVHPDELLR